MNMSNSEYGRLVWVNLPQLEATGHAFVRNTPGIQSIERNGAPGVYVVMGDGGRVLYKGGPISELDDLRDACAQLIGKLYPTKFEAA